MIQISIVIVNYKAYDLLKDCLNSIYTYTIDVSFEIILVDNNSDEDKLLDIVKKYTSLRIIAINHAVGFAEANNRAIEVANGKYILFLNNDTIFVENTLRILWEYAEKIEEDLAIGCRLLNKDGSNQISIVDFFNIYNLVGESFFLYKLFPKSKLLNRNHFNYKQIHSPLEVDYVKGAFIFCNLTLVKNLEGFDDRFYFYGEEVDLCYRAKLTGAKIIYYPGTSIIHLGGATTKNNLWFMFKNQKIATVRFFQKHFHGLWFSLAIFIYHVGILIRIPIYLIGSIFSFNLFLFRKSFYYLRQLFIYPKNVF